MLDVRQLAWVCICLEFACLAEAPEPLDLLGDDSMVIVPGDVFEMGSRTREEEPLRYVAVDSFYIDRTEVTADDYLECARAKGCRELELATSGSLNYKVYSRRDHPINGVTWFDARAYCGWVANGTKRLPTEAEWEMAARGLTFREYPWGDRPEASCEYTVMSEGEIGGCGAGTTLSVGSRTRDSSPYGVLDMGGNVSEWVGDWFGEYDLDEVDNPKGPNAGETRVVRGGAWVGQSAELFRTGRRESVSPSTVSSAIGFRCVSTVLP